MPAPIISSAHNRNARFYIGTYTHSSPTAPFQSEGIYSGGIDMDTGRLNSLTLAGKVENPSFLAFSPRGNVLYAAIERPEGAVAAFRVDSHGSLAPLNELQAAGAGTCHVSVDVSGQFVFAANYRGASFSAFETVADGALGKRTSTISLNGRGPHPTRQQQSFGHAIYPSLSNRFVLGCDLGADKVWCMPRDPAAGIGGLDVSLSGKLPPGSGPRHLVLHPEGRFIYVCNELNSTITSCVCDPGTGGITAWETVPLLGPEANVEEFGTAEILMHPSGRWLYVSNRDIGNRGRDFIAVLSVGRDGRLAAIQRRKLNVRQPRSFDIDPSGRWLVVAGQADHRIAVMKIQPETGELEPTDQMEEIPAPACILFARVASQLRVSSAQPVATTESPNGRS